MATVMMMMIVDCSTYIHTYICVEHKFTSSNGSKVRTISIHDFWRTHMGEKNRVGRHTQTVTGNWALLVRLLRTRKKEKEEDENAQLRKSNNPNLMGGE